MQSRCTYTPPQKQSSSSLPSMRKDVDHGLEAHPRTVYVSIIDVS